jgi:hypothetical protein
MIRLAIITGFILALTTCASNINVDKDIDLSDSTLAILPDWTIYYCDTTKEYSDSIPCVEVFANELRRNNDYYIIAEYDLGNPASSINNDTFFITQFGNWYQRYNGSWSLFFSPALFTSKTKTSIKRNGLGTSNLEEWTPDSQYVSKKYGKMYVFKLAFPLSNESEEVSVHFSPYYGQVHVVGQHNVISINRIDSLK